MRLRCSANLGHTETVIHDLDVQDKHHSLIPGVMTFASPALSCTMTLAGRISPLSAIQAPSNDLRLIFPEDLTGQELIPTLHELVELVAGIVEAFKALPSS